MAKYDYWVVIKTVEFLLSSISVRRVGPIRKVL
jgi:hypothetical protein